MKKILLGISGLAIFIALLWFGWSFRAENATLIDLDLVWLRFSNVELWRVVLVAIGAGAIGSAILVGFAWLRGRLLNRRYRRAIQKLETELHELRSLPLTGSEPPLDLSTQERV